MALYVLLDAHLLGFEIVYLHQQMLWHLAPSTLKIGSLGLQIGLLSTQGMQVTLRYTYNPIQLSKLAITRTVHIDWLRIDT